MPDQPSLKLFQLSTIPIMSAISIDAIFLVTNEVVTITSAMRKNAQWANSGMASILGGPPQGQHNSLATHLGLRARNGSISSVSIIYKSADGFKLKLTLTGKPFNFWLCKTSIRFSSL